MKTWFLATRPWSFTMSAISVTLGAVWAAGRGFSFGWYLLTLLAMVLLHGATNLLNDYFDVKNRVDTPESPTTRYRPHPLMNREIGLNQVLAVSVAMYVLGSGLGIFLAAARGWPVLLIGLIGVAVSLLYTAPFLSLKYHALGEPMVFLMWGPLAVCGSFYVQAREFAPEVLLVSLPFGALVALVLLANNLRDASQDEKQNITTLAVLSGARAGRYVYAGLMALAFFGVFFMSIFGPLSPWSLLVLASIPLSIPLFRMVSGPCPDDADARTAKLDTAFGLLLIVTVLLQRLT